MNELIKVAYQTVGSRESPSVNARELHSFLEVRKVFAAWIQERIEQYGFVENRDFAVFSDFGKNPQGGRPKLKWAENVLNLIQPLQEDAA